MKYEIASELGLPVKQGSEDYWGYISSRDCGKVGGQMLRRMVHFAESAMARGISIYGSTPAQGGPQGAAGSRIRIYAKIEREKESISYTLSDCRQTFVKEIFCIRSDLLQSGNKT